MAANRHLFFVPIVLAPFGLLCLFLATSEPLVAIVGSIAVYAAIAIFVWPSIGVYAIAMLVIGHWPWGIMRNLGALTVASTGLWILLNRKSLYPRNIILILVTCFMAFVLVSAIRPQTRIELLSSVLQYAGHSALVWLFTVHVDNRRMLLRIIWLAVIAGMITALIGIVQWRTHFVWIQSTTRYGLEVYAETLEGQTAFDVQSWQGQFRIDSITGTQDFLPLTMQCLMPFVGFWTVRQSQWSRRIAGVCVFLLFGFVHILSFTRGAILTTGFVLLLMGVTIDRRRFLVFGVPVAIAGFMALMCWAPWRERVVTIVTLQTPGVEEEHLQTGVWRIKTSLLALRIISQHPFLGVGVGQQQWNWPKDQLGVLIPDQSIPQPIHNSYLRIGIELGIGGMIVLFALVGVCFRELTKIVRRLKAAQDQQMADMAMALRISFVGAAIAMIIYPMIFNFRYFWLLIALTAAFVRIEGNMPTPPKTVGA